MSYLWYALSFSFYIFTTNSQELGYSWLPYNGTIPENAIIGGQDVNGGNIYIGQAPIENLGLLVGEIFPGKKEVEIPYYSYITKTLTSRIGILCGSKTGQAGWLRIDLDNPLHLSLIGKHAIIGGYEFIPYYPDGYLYVGRISYKNEIKIGKVTAYSVDDARLHFLHRSEVFNSTVYEVLLWQNIKYEILRDNILV